VEFPIKFKINQRVLYTLFSAGIIILGSFAAIRFAQGYRITSNGRLQNTGLLNANSFPSGAEVYIDNKLVSATDNTLNLDPKEYDVLIQKEGYGPWEKKLRVENGLVTQTNAQLFRLVPGLTPLTFTGATNISPSPDGQRLIFYTASASSKIRNGLYILDLSNSLLTTPKEAHQIAEESPGFDLNSASFTWSPDSTEVLMSTTGHDVLLDLTKQNVLSSLPDVGLQKKEMFSDWESQMYLRERQFFAKFPDEIIKIATQSAKNVYLSPDKKKILYTATASATIPGGLEPPLPASDNQPESRMIASGNTYVYDSEEDKNFLLSVTTQTPLVSDTFLATDLYRNQPLTLDASPSAFLRLQASSSAQTALNFARFYSSLYTTGVQWFPDSKHVFFSDKDKIYIVEYDNTNKNAVYSGPFTDNFVYPWPDGSKLLILTSFSTNSPENLYAIELK